MTSALERKPLVSKAVNVAWREFNAELKSRGYKNGMDGGVLIWVIVIFTYLSYFAPFVLLLSGALTEVWHVLLAGVAQGCGWIMMAGVGHDANHGGLTHHKKLNEVFKRTLDLIGLEFKNWGRHHDQHHLYANVYSPRGVDSKQSDPDSSTGEKFLAFSQFATHLKTWFRPYQHLFANFLYIITFHYWFVYGEFQRTKRYFNPEKDGTLQHRMREVLIKKILYGVFFIVLPVFSAAPFWAGFLQWFVCVGFAGFVLMPFLQMAHINEYAEQFQKRPDDMARSEFQARVSVNIHWKLPVINWFMAVVFFSGLGRQGGHHDKQALNRVHLIRWTERLKQVLKPLGVPVYDYSFWHMFASNHRKMRSMGRIPSYAELVDEM